MKLTKQGVRQLGSNQRMRSAANCRHFYFANLVVIGTRWIADEYGDAEEKDVGPARYARRAYARVHRG